MTTSQDHGSLISVRIVTLDYIMSPPLVPELDPFYSSYRSSTIKRLPIIRIFGPTPSGQKTCLHIHGVFPYIYIQLPPGKDPDEYGYRLSLSLDKALNMVLGAGSSNHHVFKVVSVKGKSMYGYHSNESVFLKIYFYNPGFIKRAVDLLHNGAIMDQIIDPYESHIPFTLQFMMDYNLQGMNLIHLSSALFRQSPSEEASSLKTQHSLTPRDLLQFTPNKRIFNVNELSSELVLDASVPKTTRSSLECDGVAVDILNRNSGANPGLSAMWEDEALRRRSKGLDENEIPNPSSPSRGESQNRLTDSEEFWSRKFKEMIANSVSSDEGKNKETFANIPSSNHLDTFVTSLNVTSSEEDSPRLLNDSQISSYLDETIVNEDIVSSLSGVTLDENDKELIDLLAQEESEDETFEMSQIIWDSDPFSQES